MELTGDGGKMHIPTLKVRNERGIIREVNTNDEKRKLSQKSSSPLSQVARQFPRIPNTLNQCQTLPQSPKLKYTSRLKGSHLTRPADWTASPMWYYRRQ